MSTTTIRVDLETHARLVELGSARRESLMQTVRDAVDALHREQFAHQVSSELAALRGDGEAWAAYLADAETTNVADGIG